MTLCLTQLEEQAKHVVHSAGIDYSVTGGQCWVQMPIRIHSEANERGSHWPRTNRFKKQRKTVAWALWTTFRGATPVLPRTITLTRYGKGLLDDDNLAGGFKAVRDEIAAWLGVDDADPRVTWRYAQEKSKTYACRISIEERA